jgi:hypothetical protein
LNFIALLTSELFLSLERNTFSKIFCATKLLTFRSGAALPPVVRKGCAFPVLLDKIVGGYAARCEA